jgi:hypothetical protein
MSRQRLIDFDRDALKPGLLVEARWQAKGREFIARATVRNTTRLLVTAVLTEDRGDPFHPGSPVTVPRVLKPKWSLTNGAFPLAELPSATVATPPAHKAPQKKPRAAASPRKAKASGMSDLLVTLHELAGQTSIAEVARRIGTDRPHLSRILSGETPPGDFTTLRRLYKTYPKKFPYLKHILGDTAGRVR